MITVALVGADGAGKSSVVARLPDVLPHPCRTVYMGENPTASKPRSRVAATMHRLMGGPAPTGGPPPVHTAERPETRLARAMAKGRGLLDLVALVSEERARQRHVRRLLAQGFVVVTDRDFYADYFAHDLVGPDRTSKQRLHGTFLRRWYRRPDLLVVLDAPAEVLRSRSGEGTLDELESRRLEYLDLLPDDRPTAVIDASRPLAEVVDAVVAVVVAHLDQMPQSPPDVRRVR